MPESLGAWLACPTDTSHDLALTVGRNGFEARCETCETTFSYTF